MSTNTSIYRAWQKSYMYHVHMMSLDFINNYNIHICTMHMECSPDSEDRLLQYFNKAKYKHVHWNIRGRQNWIQHLEKITQNIQHRLWHITSIAYKAHTAYKAIGKQALDYSLKAHWGHKHCDIALIPTFLSDFYSGFCLEFITVCMYSTPLLQCLWQV